VHYHQQAASQLSYLLKYQPVPDPGHNYLTLLQAQLGQQLRGIPAVDALINCGKSGL
jgi:hypothetical protein